jgi:hypothetical protein
MEVLKKFFSLFKIVFQPPNLILLLIRILVEKAFRIQKTLNYMFEAQY